MDIGIRTLILFIKSKLHVYNNLTEFNNFRKGSDATWFHEFLNANVSSKFSGIRRISYSPGFCFNLTYLLKYMTRNLLYLFCLKTIF